MLRQLLFLSFIMCLVSGCWKPFEKATATDGGKAKNTTSHEANYGMINKTSKSSNESDFSTNLNMGSSAKAVPAGYEPGFNPAQIYNTELGMKAIESSVAKVKAEKAWTLYASVGATIVMIIFVVGAMGVLAGWLFLKRPQDATAIAHLENEAKKVKK